MDFVATRIRSVHKLGELQGVGTTLRLQRELRASKGKRGGKKGDKSNYCRDRTMVIRSGHVADSPHRSWGMVFHVLNRANARARIFAKDVDYAAWKSARWP